MSELTDPRNWKYSSSSEEGLQEVIHPDNSACRITWIFRLNLSAGNSYNLQKDGLELNAVVLSGVAEITHNGQTYDLKKLDSFYLPGDEPVSILAKDDLLIFIGGSHYEGIGDFFVRHYDPDLPLGDIRQVHGEPPYQRDVFMTIAQQDKGSRLICGITSGDNGGWTSWPPHQHSKDLEEVYCYFDIPEPNFALHLSSRKAGVVEAVHPVSTGDCVVIPEGYHPTVGIPGSKSCYFWVMAAHAQSSRRYDLAVNDPNFG